VRAAFGAALALTIALAVVLTLAHVNRSPLEPLRVVSGSMRPTIAIGQIVHVDPSAYASSPPRIGDIVAFRAPEGAIGETPVCGVSQPPGEVCPQSTPTESDEIFVKRVVAAPGDTISVVDGHVVRDGTTAPEPFVAPCGDGDGCSFPVPAEVPSGQWFVMGDDRGSSDDSRYWGPVPAAWIVGKVVR